MIFNLEVRKLIKTAIFQVSGKISLDDEASISLSDNHINFKLNQCHWKILAPIHFQTLASPQIKLEDGGLYVNMKIEKGNPIKAVNTDPRISQEIKPETSYSVYCSICSNLVVKSHKFRLVLPLPSSNWKEKAGDWFCHSGNMSFDVSFSPKIDMCLTGVFNYLISDKVLDESKTKIEKNKLVCLNCDNVIGTQSGNSVTLYKDSVRWILGFNRPDNDLPPTGELKSRNELNKALLYSIITTDVLTLLSNFLHTFLNEGLGVNNKIVLQGCSKDNFLLLWILDKNVDVYMGETDTKGLVMLENKFLYKVLYSKNRQLYKTWSKDDVDTLDISDKGLEKVNNHLGSYKNVHPPSCRIVGEFYVGYLQK